MSQCAFELGMTVFVSGLFELRGLDAGASQKQVVCHATKHDADGGRRHSEEGRTTQDAAQYPGVLRVGRRVRGNNGYGTTQSIHVYSMNDGTDHIVERDPEPVLSPCPDLASPTELEDG